MHTPFFDSHKHAKRLIDSGVLPATADVHAETMTELMAHVADSAATVDKQDNKIDRLDAKIDKVAAGNCVSLRTLGTEITFLCGNWAG